MNERPMQHDYTYGTRKNGWAIMDFDFNDTGKVKIVAFGLKRGMPSHTPREHKCLLPGEEIVITLPDGDVLYEILEIRYRHNPCDMYEAELKYIQHLTGLRIVTQTEKRQQDRQLEWSQRLKTRVTSQ